MSQTVTHTAKWKASSNKTRKKNT